MKVSKWCEFLCQHEIVWIWWFVVSVLVSYVVWEEMKVNFETVPPWLGLVLDLMQLRRIYPTLPATRFKNLWPCKFEKQYAVILTNKKQGPSVKSKVMTDHMDTSLPGNWIWNTLKKMTTKQFLLEVILTTEQWEYKQTKHEAIKRGFNWYIWEREVKKGQCRTYAL